MSPLLLALVAASSVPMRSATSPRAALVVTLTPKGAPALSAAALLDAVGTALRGRTRLTARSPEQVGIDVGQFAACPIDRRLGCWAALTGSAVDYLLVLTVHPGEKDRILVSVAGVDPVSTKEMLALVDRSDPEWRQNAEDELYAATPQTELTLVGSSNRALTTYFEGVLETLIRPTLRARGLWGPFGSIEVRLDAPSPFDVALNGKPIARQVEPFLRIINVEPGPHEVVVASADFERKRRIEVVPGETTELQIQTPSKGWGPVRLATAAGGAVFVASGLTLMTVAALQSSGAAQVGCIGNGGCSGPSGLPVEGTQTPQIGDVEVQARTRLVPLGVGLFIAGGVAGSGALLWGPQEIPPWWPIVGGLLAGLTATAITYALPTR